MKVQTNVKAGITTVTIGPNNQSVNVTTTTVNATNVIDNTGAVITGA